MATANASNTLTASRSLPARAWGAQRRIRALKLPWISIMVLALLIICAVFAPLMRPMTPGQSTF